MLLGVVAGVRLSAGSAASPVCAAHSASLLQCIMDDDWDTDMLRASCKRMAKRLRRNSPCKAAKRKPSLPKASVAKHKHAATMPAEKACETRKGAVAEVRRAAARRPHPLPLPPNCVQKKGRGKNYSIRWGPRFHKRLKALVERSLNTEKIESKAYDREAVLNKFRLGSHGNPIRFGSDCSGMECFIEAFKRLGLSNRLRVEFCSDTDETCRLWLRHQSLKPKNVYDDLRGG